MSIASFCNRVLTIGLLFLSGVAQAARIEGTLREKGTRKPITQANVYLLPVKLRAQTDGEGKFFLEDLEPGDYQVVVSIAGYRKLEEQVILTQPESVLSASFYIERTSYLGFETTIYGKQEKRDNTTRVLKRESFDSPGSGGDPIKAVQNMPGVSRIGGLQSNVVIQGSAPQDTVYTLESHEIPLIFHFGGLTSVIFPDALDRLEYLSAGYGPEYGRALGGVVGGRTRNARRDGWHGLAFFDAYNMGALVEGPIGEKSSILAAGRVSYIGAALRAAFEDNEDFNLTVAPSFADILSIYETSFSEKDDFRFVVAGSRDKLEFLLKSPVNQDPDLRGEFSTFTAFYRIIPQWHRKWNAKRTSRLSLGLGQDWIRFVIGTNYFDLKSLPITARGEWEEEFSEGLKLLAGFDNDYAYAQVGLRLPFVSGEGGVSNPLGTSEVLEYSDRSSLKNVGTYARLDWKPFEKWKFSPGLRIDSFSQTREILWGPRMGISYSLTESLELKAAGGLYHQPPEPQETNERTGNPDLNAPRAWHAVLGLEKDFRKGRADGFRFESSLFYRGFEQLVNQTSDQKNVDGTLVPVRYNNDLQGRAFGAESRLLFDSDPWALALSYTLSRSERWRPGEATFRSPFDQPHNLNFLGSIKLPRNWKISTRFRIVSGNPITPITGGVYDSDNDVYIPIRGPNYSARLPAFNQLDLRIDKKWIGNSFILTAYLDIQNVLNRKNVEGRSYSYDYSRNVDQTGLPIIPSLGLKGEF